MWSVVIVSTDVYYGICVLVFFQTFTLQEAGENIICYFPPAGGDVLYCKHSIEIK